MHQRKSPAAAVQDRWPPYSARPVLHLPARRKPLDIDALSPNPRAHRATRVASDVIGQTAQTGRRMGAGGGVSEAGGSGGKLREASHGPLSKPTGKRTRSTEK